MSLDGVSDGPDSWDQVCKPADGGFFHLDLFEYECGG